MFTQLLLLCGGSGPGTAAPSSSIIFYIIVQIDSFYNRKIPLLCETNRPGFPAGGRAFRRRRARPGYLSPCGNTAAPAPWKSLFHFTCVSAKIAVDLRPDCGTENRLEGKMNENKGYIRFVNLGSVPRNRRTSPGRRTGSGPAAGLSGHPCNEGAVS